MMGNIMMISMAVIPTTIIIVIMLSVIRIEGT